MIRVHVICEGQTEEMFVNELLQESFLSRGIELRPSRIGKPGHKGGNVRFDRLLTDLRIRLLDDTSAYCTTFLDYYGIASDFPGKEGVSSNITVDKKYKAICEAMFRLVCEKLGDNAVRRFIPYIQMYEFEGLLFSDPAGLAKSMDKIEFASYFAETRNDFSTPEMINDSPITAPSKRILGVVSNYQKPIMGSLAAIEIGLQAIRRECQYFDQWLRRLESLGISE